MKTNVKKIIACLILLLLGVGNIVGQSYETEGCYAFYLTTWYNYIGSNTTITIYTEDGRSYTCGSIPTGQGSCAGGYDYLSCGWTNFYGKPTSFVVNLPPGSGVANPTFTINENQYHPDPGVSFDIKDRNNNPGVGGTYVISGGNPIKEVSFEDTENNYACSDVKIKILMNGTYPLGYGYNTFIECKNIGGEWQTIGMEQYSFSTDFQHLKNHNIDPYQDFIFRTKVNLYFKQWNSDPPRDDFDPSIPYSTHTYSRAMHYFPKFEFPPGTKVDVIPPACKGEPTKIMIPYEGTINYNFTIKGTLGDWANGYNYAWENPAANGNKVQKTPTHYIITDDFPTGNNILIIEYGAFDGKSPCPYDTAFTVPSIPAFTIGTLQYPSSTPNIQKIGDKVQVSFSVSGSKSQSITVYADSASQPKYQNIVNLPGPPSNGYYSGTASINLPAGTYSIYVSTNSPSPCISDKRSITLTQPAPIDFSYSTEPPSCRIQTGLVNGSTSDGKIILSGVTGGIGKPYYYKINSASTEYPITNTGITIENRSATTYSITVLDGAGNAKTVSGITVPLPNAISITSSTTSPSLWCLPDGKIVVSASGGTGTLEYSKESNKGFSTDNTLLGYPYGLVDFYVKDSCDCVIKRTTTISSTSALSVSSKTEILPTCPIDDDEGGRNGICVLHFANRQGTLSVTDTKPFIPQSNIDTNGSTITFTGLLPGSYTCTIIEKTDAGQCELENVTFKIDAKPAINVGAKVTPVSDKGSETGKIVLNPSGGNGAPFTFSLSDDDSKSYTETSPGTFSGLSGDANGGKSYNLVVKDSKGCEKDTIILIPEPQTALQLQATVTPVSCYGGNNGIVTLEASGGWDAYDYEYSTDSTEWSSQNVYTGYSKGTYKFYVRDKYKGSKSVTVTIGQPNLLTVSLDSIFHVPCNGGYTGWIRYKVSGGTYPYTLTTLEGSVSYSIANGDTLVTVSGLRAKEDYIFTIKDSRNCSVITSQETITQPTQLQLSISSPTHTTCGLDNGELKVQASGGVAPYIYKLSAQNNVSYTQTQDADAGEQVSFKNLPADTYRITVTDDNNCEVQSALQTINPYTNPAISGAVVNNVVCFGESNGEITATAQKGTANIDYFILTKKSDDAETKNTTGIFEDLPAGDYTLHVFDTNGCQSNAYPIIVGQPDTLRIEVDAIVPVINKGANDGVIQFRVTGGNTGNVAVYLRDAENIKTDSAYVVRGHTNELPVKAGTYTLEAIDSKDCQFTTDILPVDEPADSLRLIIKEVQDALCKSQTGKIVVEGEGGWGGYRYKRASGGQYAELNRFENLYPGTYHITVMDKKGATATQSVTVYEPQDSLKAEIVNLQIPTCAGNGAMSISLSGGTPPYKLFSEAGNDTIFADVSKTVQWANIESGALLLHLTDANGCKFELETVVTDTALLRINGFETIPPNVPQGANGTIKAKISGGELPLIYAWKKIGYAASYPNNPQINNLSSGYYELKVTDGIGCNVTNSVYLPDPSDETMTVVETGDETAVDAANGYAILYYELNLTNVRVIDPENNYVDYPATTNNADFHISNNNIYLNNLSSGKWFIIGTNTLGKNAIAGFEIKPYKAFVFGRIDVIPASSPDGSDGSISVEIQGGAGGNTFVWTDEQGNTLSSSDDEYSTRLSDLPAGKYTLTVTDKYGNTISKEIEVLAPEQALQLTILEQKNQSCNGMVNAYAILSAIGGWGDYRYAHYRQPQSNNFEYSNAETYSELETGDHYFYTVDKYGKTAQLKVIVTEPDLLRASVANIENVRCKDEVNGKITFNISGGNTPYYFKKSGTNVWQEGNIAINLPVGLHTFEFTDSLQCTSPDILTVTVTEPDSLLFRIIDVTHTTCSEDNGQIEVSPKGGTRPYAYQWKDPEDNIIGTDSIIAGLKQSTLYRLYVTDANGCTQYMEQLIAPSTLPHILGVETTDVWCYGESNGTARVTGVEPAIPYAPYTLTWSNGDTGEFSDRFPKGQHSVTISDENGCSTVYYFDIGQPDSLRLRISGFKEPHCFGYRDAYIHTETRGGKGSYTYEWSNGVTTPDNDSIPKGDYWVRVTDENGCTDEKHFTMNEPDYLSVDLGKDVMMCPGNTHVIDGGNYVSYRWFTDKGDISNERYLSVTKEDRYYLEAKMPDGCSAWGDIGITIGNNALQADMLLASEAAVGDTLVIFELSNLPLDSLKWQYDPAVFEQLTIKDEYYNLPYVVHLRCLQTGVYNIGLTAYSGGCYAPVVKQIEIVAEREKEEDDWWNTTGPLIQSLKQYPNPTNGIFSVELELREEAEAKFVIFEVASGICVNQRTETGSDYYKVNYNLGHLQTGVYVLIVTAGNERKQVKIIIE